MGPRGRACVGTPGSRQVEPGTIRGEGGGDRGGGGGGKGQGEKEIKKVVPVSV